MKNAIVPNDETKLKRSWKNISNDVYSPTICQMMEVMIENQNTSYRDRFVSINVNTFESHLYLKQLNY